MKIEKTSRSTKKKTKKKSSAKRQYAQQRETLCNSISHNIRSQEAIGQDTVRFEAAAQISAGLSLVIICKFEHIDRDKEYTIKL